jgi:GH24 family phage-related lysozyme (muramidase)
MKTSVNGILFIKREEGFTATPKDDNGHTMWGHGHDQRDNEPIPPFITPPEAHWLLLEDLDQYIEPHVNALAPWATQNQFDALVDFCYNEGPGALATMLHHGQEQVTKQIMAWCYEHVNGVLHKSEALAARRAREVVLYGSEGC